MDMAVPVADTDSTTLTKSCVLSLIQHLQQISSILLLDTGKVI